MILIPKEEAVKAASSFGLRPKETAIKTATALLRPKAAAIRAAKAKPKYIVNLLIPKKSALMAARLAERAEYKKQHRYDNIIMYYLNTFDNIISSRIKRAIFKFKCLQHKPEEVKEDLYSKFKVKFCRAMIDGSIKLERVTDKSMNVYIQKMIDRLITDEIRSKSREYTHCKDVACSSDNLTTLFDTIMSHNQTPTTHLSLHRYYNGEHDLITKETWEYIIYYITRYEPEKLPTLRKVLDPNNDTNFSSPSVHLLKQSIKHILKELDNE